MERLSYAVPQLKVYGTVQELTQQVSGEKSPGEPNDGNYLNFNGGVFPLTGSCHCTGPNCN